MNDMRKMTDELAEKQRQQAVYERAMASLKQQDYDEEGAGLTLMFGWDEFGEQVRNPGLIATAAKGAELFCLGFAFVAPVILFMLYAF